MVIQQPHHFFKKKWQNAHQKHKSPLYSFPIGKLYSHISPTTSNVLNNLHPIDNQLSN